MIIKHDIIPLVCFAIFVRKNKKKPRDSGNGKKCEK